MTGTGGLFGIGSEPNRYHPRLSNTRHWSSHSEMVSVETKVTEGNTGPIDSEGE